MPPLTPSELAVVREFHKDVLAKAEDLLSNNARIEGAYIRALNLALADYEKWYDDSAPGREAAAQDERARFRAAVEQQAELNTASWAAELDRNLAAQRKTHEAEMEALRALINPHEAPIGRRDLVQVWSHSESHPTLGGLVLVVDKIVDGAVLGYYQLPGEYGHVGAQKFVSVPLDQLTRVGHAKWVILALQ